MGKIQASMGFTEGTGHSGTAHEGPEGEWMCSSTLSLSSSLDGRWIVSATPRSPDPREREPLPVLCKAGWSAEPLWTGAENLALAGI